MHLLAVPNWSIGRERTVLREARDMLEAEPIAIHYLQSDIDHNRTVTAISGEHDVVFSAINHLAEIFLPAIDLNRHRGVHPRIGALDVCPFIPLPEPTPDQAPKLHNLINNFAEYFANQHQIPVFLYEKSEQGHHSAQLPQLRKGGFGGLLDHELSPDYGPTRAHPHLGATIIGWRDFLVALNINFQSEDVVSVQRIAQKIRQLRQQKDPRFIGVRALGFPLAAQGLVQVSMNVTQPDKTPLDPIIESVRFMAEKYGLKNGYPELIGVIRDIDIEHSVHIAFRPEQVIHTRNFANPINKAGD